MTLIFLKKHIIILQNLVYNPIISYFCTMKYKEVNRTVTDLYELIDVVPVASTEEISAENNIIDFEHIDCDLVLSNIEDEIKNSILVDFDFFDAIPCSDIYDYCLNRKKIISDNTLLKIRKKHGRARKYRKFMYYDFFGSQKQYVFSYRYCPEYYWKYIHPIDDVLGNHDTGGVLTDILKYSSQLNNKDIVIVTSNFEVNGSLFDLIYGNRFTNCSSVHNIIRTFKFKTLKIYNIKND